MIPCWFLTFAEGAATSQRQGNRPMTAESETRAAISAANQSLMANFGRQDSAAMASLYTESGQLLPPNSDIVDGTSAIQAFWQGAFDMGLRQAYVDAGLEHYPCNQK